MDHSESEERRGGDEEERPGREPVPLTRLRAFLRHPDVENLKDITLDLQGTLSMIPHGFTRLKSLEKLVRPLLAAGPRVGFLLTSAGAG